MLVEECVCFVKSTSIADHLTRYICRHDEIESILLFCLVMLISALNLSVSTHTWQINSHSMKFHFTFISIKQPFYCILHVVWGWRQKWHPNRRILFLDLALPLLQLLQFASDISVSWHVPKRLPGCTLFCGNGQGVSRTFRIVSEVSCNNGLSQYFNM